MILAIQRLILDEEGATLVEYGLLLMLVALAAIASLTVFGGNISTMFSREASEI